MGRWFGPHHHEWYTVGGGGQQATHTHVLLVFLTPWTIAGIRVNAVGCSVGGLVVCSTVAIQELWYQLAPRPQSWNTYQPTHHTAALIRYCSHIHIADIHTRTK